MPVRPSCWPTPFLIALTALPALAAETGLVVFELSPHQEADRAGVRVGDRLVSWSVADDGTSALPRSGHFGDPVDLDRLRVEHGSRVPVVFGLEREGERYELALEPGTWGVAVRFELDADDLTRFEAGRDQIGADEPETVRSGLAIWAELADSWRANAPARAFWLDLLRSSKAERRGWIPEVRVALAAARALAEALDDGRRRALVAEQLGLALEHASQFDAARATFEELLVLRRDGEPGSLALADAYEHLGRVAWSQDRLDDALLAQAGALAIREAVAPEGLPAAESYNDLGLIAWSRGDLDTCERYHRRALAIRRRLAPLSLRTAFSLVNLGIVAWKRGAMAEAEAAYEEARSFYEQLRPDSVEMARLLNNLGIVHMNRGRLVEAEALFLRSLELYHRWGTSRGLAHLHTNLGELLEGRGEPGLAREHLRRALAIKEELGLRVDAVPTLFALADVESDAAESERLLERARTILETDAPESFHLPEALLRLGRSARARGRGADADRLLAESLLTAGRVSPGSWLEARILREIAVVDIEEGRPAAQEKLERSLELVLASLPGTSEEVRSRHQLARSLAGRGAVDEALAMFSAAESVLEDCLEDREGEADERARYRSTWAELFLDHLELLVSRGRLTEAFAVTERYRAQELTRLLSARDVELPELPRDLVRRRQVAQSRYRRLLAERRATPRPPTAAAREELLSARREQLESERQIALSGLRIEKLRRPSSIDAEAARRALEPGTALLSFVVGFARSWLFVLGPDAAELRVVPIDAGRDTLERRVRSLRAELVTPSVRSGWRLEAGRLASLLLGPAEERISSAERLLVLPDGPLHFLPFAVLPSPGTDRLLVEKVPIQYAASMTVLGELVRGRAGPRPSRLVAFADPRYDDAGLAPRAAAAARAAERGLAMPPLPSSRREAERIRDLFPGPSSIWLGEAATEERAKAVGSDVTHLHFACHALVDPRAPLDSGLALAQSGATDREDGFLQAWEIVEQMRLSADLVVMSACETAGGEELPGEGVLGLVGAFHLAGARAVLATQWQVADRSASEVAAEFYERLRRGAAAGDALRDAQLHVARRPETAHPYYWAAFQLFGDAR